MKSKITLQKYCFGARRRVERLMRNSKNPYVEVMGGRTLRVIDELENTGEKLERKFKEGKAK